jgi:hypothetical protein
MEKVFHFVLVYFQLLSKETIPFLPSFPFETPGAQSRKMSQHHPLHFVFWPLNP